MMVLIAGLMTTINCYPLSAYQLHTPECDQHLATLSKTLDQLTELLHKYKGVSGANVMDCLMMQGELGTLNDEQKWFDICFSTFSESSKLNGDVIDTNREVHAAMSRIGCSSQ
jgi:hypothetical protein